MSRAYSNSTDAGEAAAAAAFDGPDFAIGMWIKTSTVGANGAGIYTRHSSSASFSGFTLFLDSSSGVLKLQVKSASSGQEVGTGSTDLRTGNWQFVGADLRQTSGNACRVVWGSGSGNRASVNLSLSWSFAGHAVRIGRSVDSWWATLSGSAAHAFWASRPLTDGEWDSLAGGGNPLAVIGATDLAAYWPLAGTTNPEPDDSGNGRTLTMTGTGQGADDPAVDPPPSSNPTSRLAPDAIAASTNLSGVLGNIQESVL